MNERLTKAADVYRDLCARIRATEAERDSAMRAYSAFESSPEYKTRYSTFDTLRNEVIRLAPLADKAYQALLKAAKTNTNLAEWADNYRRVSRNLEDAERLRKEAGVALDAFRALPENRAYMTRWEAATEALKDLRIFRDQAEKELREAVLSDNVTT